MNVDIFRSSGSAAPRFEEMFPLQEHHGEINKTNGEVFHQMLGF